MNFTEPYILNDFTRLPEIYKLRVLAWENSPGKINVNSTKYPNGFYDHLEDKSIHFISTNNNDEIIAAARLTVCNNIDELPYPGIFKPYVHLFPQTNNFLLYSRLVVHPNYRKLGLSDALDHARYKSHKELGVEFGVVTVKSHRHDSLLKNKWDIIGPVLNEKDSNYIFTGENSLLLLLLSNIK